MFTSFIVRWEALATMIKTSILSLLMCLLLFLQHSNASATEYSLPYHIDKSGPFNDCSKVSPKTYDCDGGVNVGTGNKLVITEDVTLNVSGEFKVADNSLVDKDIYVFNVSASTLHIDGDEPMVFNSLTALGYVQIHKKANLTANVTSTSGNIEIWEQSTINGNITADSGKVSIWNSTIYGNITADDITIDSSTDVYGTCTPSHSQCTPIMVDPTVASQTTSDNTPVVYGTYSSSVATSLNVTVNTVTYSLSTSSELTNSSDNWTLDLSSITPLDVKTYEVVATSADGSISLSDNSINELVIIEYSAEWWNTNWTKCRNITIANTGTTTLSNFPAYIDLPYDADMQSNYNDIRFINTSCANGGFELDFEIETDTAASADVWVEIDNLPAAGTTIAVYYGNASAASGENITGTWVSSHKGVWHLSEDTGAPNQDSTINSNVGTPQESPASSIGKIGKALDFNGANETRVDLGKDDSLDLSTSNYNNWTISLWVKPYSSFTDSDYPIIYQYDNYGASVGLDKGNGKIEHWRNNDTALYSDDSLNIGEWNHVVVTRGNANTTFYLNGNANGSDLNVDIDQDNFGSYIGGYPGYSNGDLKGVIDEVRVSDMIRTPDWIKQSYDLVQDQDDHVTIGDEMEPRPEPSQCSAIFPDGASTHSNEGTIHFGHNAQLIDSYDNQLATISISKNPGSNINTCNTINCIATGTPSDTNLTVNFQTTSSTVDVAVSPGDSVTVGSGSFSGNEFNDINPGNSQASITFSDTHSEYYVDKLILGEYSKLYLQAGSTYWINELELYNQSEVIVQGTGTALVYVNQGFDFPYKGLINSPSSNNSGDASKLLMNVYGDVRLISESTYTGSLYVQGDLALISSSYVFGAVSAANINLGSESTITYQSEELADTDFKGMCYTLTPILDYHFDELSWTGSADEVTDSSGNTYNGTAVGGITTAIGKICNAAQIPNNNSASTFEAVDTGVDLDTVIGSSGTISLWYKGDNDWNSGSDKRLFDATGGNKYFLAEIGSDGRVKFYFEDGSGGDYQKTTDSALSVEAGVWKHLTFVWDVTSITAKIFVDGVEQSVASGSNADGGTTALSGLDTLYFGDNRDASYLTGESSASGLIDEALVFDSVLTTSQIQAIFTNQDAGNNYDGSERNCLFTPLVNYRFDESSWVGATDEVVDSSGYSHHSTATNATTTEAGKICRAGNFNGSTDYLEAASPVIASNAGPYTVSAWVYRTGTSSKTNHVMGNGGNSNLASGFTLQVFKDGGGRYRTRNASQFLSINSGSVPTNAWVHMALRYDGSTLTSYLNGTLTGTDSSGTNAYGSMQNLRIGTASNSTASSRMFPGRIDEVLIFDTDLSDYQINSIYTHQNAGNNYDGSARTCPTSNVDHYRIEHDAQGFTCEAETVTIKACADENCDTLYDQETSITLSPNGWSGGNTIVFTGETTTSLSVTAEGSITLVKTSANPDADLRCFNGSTETCGMTFSNDGFEIYGANIGDLLTDQLAANNFTNVNLRAVRSNNNVCEALLEGSQTVDLTYNCVTPNECVTELSNIAINGSGLGDNTGSLSVVFDALGVANLSGLNYPDAGRLSLSVQAEVDGVTISNSNDATVDVYPSYLQLAVNQNDNVAAEPFTLSIGAYGVNDVLLKNYKAGTSKLKVKRLIPDSIHANDGNFKYGGANTSIMSTSLGATFAETTPSPLVFSDGVYSYTQAYYDEVGTVEIDTQDADYLGNIISSQGTLTLGAFIPAYFSVTKTQPELRDTCEDTFSYLGETIGFVAGSEPLLIFTGKNALDAVTENYGASPWTFNLSQSDVDNGIYLSDNSTYAAVDSFNEISKGSIPIITTGNVVYDGIIEVQIPETSFNYNKRRSNNTPFGIVSPFTASINMVFSSAFLSDEHDVCYQTDYANSECLSFTIPNITGANMRYGRLALDSTYGPETESLNVPVKVEYVDDNNQWRINSEDNCTSINFSESAGHMILESIGSVDITADINDISSDGLLLKGVTNDSNDFLLINSNNKIGEVKLRLLPGVSGEVWSDHLNYNWNGDSVLDTNDFPQATVTFGQYRGNDKIIQWREVFN